ncbi:MAG: hypothetical protein U1E86_07595 [Burkholderiaceae bacterium]
MAEPSRYSFKMNELAEILVREAGVTTGLWQVDFRFTLTAGMVGPTETECLPTALTSITEIGIVQVDKPGPLTVDAATARRARKSPLHTDQPNVAAVDSAAKLPQQVRRKRSSPTSKT